MFYSLRAARLPLFVLSAAVSLAVAGCGGGSNLPVAGSGQGGLGDTGGTTTGTALGTNAIVFVSTRDGNPEIYSMNADGTNQKRLTTNTFVDEQPSRSRDGSKIVFSSQRDGNSEIYVMNADGTGEQRLTNDGGASDAAPVDVHPVFSPDNTRIVWQSTRGGARRLYTMLATGADQTPVTFADANQRSFDGSWNPDSTRLLSLLINTSNSNLNDIALITPGTDTTPATAVTLRAGTSGAHPRYAPDGSRIVYFDAPTTGQATLQFLDASGNPTGQGPTGGTNQLGPSFSLDSKRLVWDANPVATVAQRQIYIATIGTGTTPAAGTVLTTEGENYDASWAQ